MGAMISEPALARVFVGRDAELAEIAAAFARGARSVALFGPPGAGKTRLASRLVEEDAAALRAGLVIDLAHARTAEALVASLAAAFDLQGGAGAPPDRARALAALAAWCPQLLVLDNAEGLDEAARALLSAILAGSPAGARVVVTSRDKAGLGCDVAIEIGGLGTDDDGDATRLFAERARAMGVPLGADDDAPMRAIVRALDGNPLAVELAAAQLDVLSPHEIHGRLARRLDLAADRASGARFPTLRAAITASWDALDDGARRVLATLGIFAGELSADAAEAIVDDAAIDVVAALRTLRDRSLVAVRRTASERERGGGTGKNRLRLDGSVRAFAREQLVESGRLEAVAARHAGWFVSRAATMSSALRRRGDREARAWLLDEQDELVAIAHGGGAASSLGAALALAPLWERTGRCSELIEVIDAPIAKGATPNGDEALALAIARAQAWGLAGRLAEARAVLETAVKKVFAEAAPPTTSEDPGADLAAEALTHLMVRRRQLGCVEEAIDAGERAFALLDEKAAPHLYAANAACLGLTLAEIGRPEEARRYDERARDAFRTLGDRWGEGLVLGNLAQLAQGQGQGQGEKNGDDGDLESAAHFADAAIDAFRASRDPLYEGVYLGVRAGIAREAGALDDARTGYERAVSLLAAGGARHVEGIFRAQRSGLLAMMGDHEAARGELDLAGSLLRVAGAPAYLVLLDLHAHEVELLRARAASPIDEPRRLAAEAGARSAIASAAALPAAKRSQFVAFGSRVVARVLDDRAADARRLLVAEGAAWFELPPAPRVSLAKRTAPRLVFAALVAAHERRGPAGGALGIDALFAAGWPGERAIATARANRVRVAIATLRGLGLEGVVVTEGAGYAIAGDVVVLGPR